MEARRIDVEQTPPERAGVLESRAFDTITGGVATFGGWSYESRRGNGLARPTRRELVFGERRNKQKQ